MGLLNVYKYQAEKTVKLSDSYQVSIQFYNADDPFKANPADGDILNEFLTGYPFFDSDNLILTLPECTNVTLPEIKMKEETYNYGNNSRQFLIPDYEHPADLKIELMEHEINSAQSGAGTIGLVQFLVNLLLNKLFNTATFSYKLNDYIKAITIDIFSNDFSEVTYRYTFKDLKLTNYSKYNLSYENANTCKWNLEFSYMSYSKEYIGISGGKPTFTLDPLNMNRLIEMPKKELDMSSLNASLAQQSLQNGSQNAHDAYYIALQNAIANERIAEQEKARKQAAWKKEQEQRAKAETKTVIDTDTALGYTDEKVPGSEQCKEPPLSTTSKTTSTVSVVDPIMVVQNLTREVAKERESTETGSWADFRKAGKQLQADFRKLQAEQNKPDITTTTQNQNKKETPTKTKSNTDTKAKTVSKTDPVTASKQAEQKSTKSTEALQSSTKTESKPVVATNPLTTRTTAKTTNPGTGWLLGQNNNTKTNNQQNNLSEKSTAVINNMSKEKLELAQQLAKRKKK